MVNERLVSLVSKCAASGSRDSGFATIDLEIGQILNFSTKDELTGVTRAF